MKAATIQLGYLHQFDYKISDEIGRDFIVIGFYYDLFRKSNSKQEPDKEIKDNWQSKIAIHQVANFK